MVCVYVCCDAPSSYRIRLQNNDNEQFQISKKMKTRYKKSKKKYYITHYISPTTYIHTHIPEGEVQREGRGKREGRRKGRREKEKEILCSFLSFFLLSSFSPLRSHLLSLDIDLVHDNKWAIYAANAHHQVFSFQRMRVFQ